MSLRQALGVVAFGLAAAPAGPTAELTNFALDDQAGDFLCWAAVALSVVRHQPGAGPVACQCAIVKQQFPHCGACHGQGCDIMGEVDVALASNGVQASSVPKPYNFQDVHAAIRGNRPVICRVPRDISQPTSFAHIVVIRYTDQTDQTIEIKDPSNGDKVWESISSWDFLEDHIRDLYIVQ